ncbi:hypothetical protein IJ00_03625 [Calothrix sp. 336/3]|nr:hypothetical protein [Calothrix sp. 336/3]AKG20524.1 hypothetical protein IJ00_03625 [Calothrix sp. 336/3]
MLQLLFTYFLLVCYLMMAYYFFNVWLEFFLEDEEMNSTQRRISSIALVIGSVFWILVVPFAYLELLKFHRKHKEIINLLIHTSTRINFEDEST